MAAAGTQKLLCEDTARKHGWGGGGLNRTKRRRGRIQRPYKIPKPEGI